MLLDGARSPGSTLGRALDTAMTAAADQTFRDVVREAIGRRDAVDALGRTVRAASRRPLPICRNCSASIRSDSIDGDRRRVLFGSKSSRRRNGRRSPKLLRPGARPITSRRERFRRLASLSGVRARRDLSRHFLHQREQRTHARANPSSPTLSTTPRWSSALQPNRQRVCAAARSAAAPLSAATAAPRSLTVAHEVLTPVSRREGAARPARLRRSDRQDAGASVPTSTQPGCITSSISASITCWSTRRRTPATSSGRSSAGSPPNSPPAPARASVTRTMFAVGDEKQSIYSFQDAAPKEFAEMRRHFKSAHDKSGLKFVVSKFEHSFRSGEAILGAVDEVFERADIAASVTASDNGRLSAAYRAAGRAAKRGRDLGAGEAGRARQRDRRLGRAVRHRERDEPAGEACAADRAHGAGAWSMRGTTPAALWRRTRSWCASAANCSRRSSAR